MNWRNLNNLNLCVASGVSAALRGFNYGARRRQVAGGLENLLSITWYRGGGLENRLSIGRHGVGCPGDSAVSPPPQMGDSEVSPPFEGRADYKNLRMGNFLLILQKMN